MKRFHVHYFLILGCSFLFSCSKLSSEINKKEQPIEQNDLQLLRSEGYNTEGMIEKEDYYLLKPDIIVSKSNVEQMRKTPQTRMRKSSLLNPPYYTVHIKDQHVEELKDELHQAMDAWNTLKNCGIKFVIDNSAYDAVDIYSRYDGDTYSEPMYIERPYNGKYGKLAKINLYKMRDILYQGRNIMTHLLGHIIGLEHIPSDNYLQNPPPQHISGTAYSDPKSIMRTETDVIAGTFQWSGFSATDKLDIPKIYPYTKPENSFTCKLNGALVSSTNLSLYKTYEFTALYKHPSCPSPTYSISMQQKDGYTLKSIKNGVVTVEFTKGGSFTLIAEVDNAPEKVTFEKTYTLPNPEPAVTSIVCSHQGEGTGGSMLKLYTDYQFTAS